MSHSVWRYQIYYVCAANPQFLIHWYKLSLVSFFCKINNPSLDNSFGSKIIFSLGEIWSSCLPFRLLIQTGRKRKNQMVNLTLIIKYIFSHFSFLEPIVPCMQLLFGSSNLYSHRPSVAFHYFGWLPNKWLMFAIGSFHLWTSEGKSNHTNWWVAARRLLGISDSYEILDGSSWSLNSVNNLDNRPSRLTLPLASTSHTLLRFYFVQMSYKRETVWSSV